VFAWFIQCECVVGEDRLALGYFLDRNKSTGHAISLAKQFNFSMIVEQGKRELLLCCCIMENKEEVVVDG
jgi:hypothetical protein